MITKWEQKDLLWNIREAESMMQKVKRQLDSFGMEGFSKLADVAMGEICGLSCAIREIEDFKEE